MAPIHPLERTRASNKNEPHSTFRTIKYNTFQNLITARFTLVYAKFKRIMRQHDKRGRGSIVTGRSYATLERRILRANLCHGSKSRARAACSREQKSPDSTGMNTMEERKLLGILLEFRATTPARR